MTKKLSLCLFGFFAFIFCVFCFETTKVFALETPTYNIESNTLSQQEPTDSSLTAFCDVTIVDNILYVANSKQATKVVGYNLNEQSNDCVQIDLPDNYYPTKIEYDFFNEEFYFLSKLTLGIGTTNSPEQYTVYYQETDLETPISMLLIYDFTISMNGTIFALTSNIDNDFVIIYKQSDAEKFKLLCNLSNLSTPIELNDTSKIVCDAYGTTIWFNASNTVYEYNISNGFSNLSYVLPSNISNIADMQLDFMSNLYILATESSTQAFIKSTRQNYQIVYDDQNVLFANGFCINYEDGNAYTYTDIQLYCAKITYDEKNFFTNYNEIQPDTSWQTAEISQVCDILKTTTETMIYPYDTLYKKGETIPENTKVILLNNLPNSMFNFVLLNNHNSTNKVGYIKKNQLTTQGNINLELTQVSPIFSKTPIYRYPSTLLTEDNNELICCTANYQSQNTAPVFNILVSAEIPTDFNNVNFYAVKYGNIIGYVDSNMVIPATEKALQRIFISNAKTYENAKIYSDFNLTKLSAELDANTAIQVENTENGVCKIYWLNDDEIFVGYISKNFVNDGSLTTTQITGIAIMSVAIITTVLVLIISGIRHKRLKRKIEQTKQALEN